MTIDSICPTCHQIMTSAGCGCNLLFKNIGATNYQDVIVENLKAEISRLQGEIKQVKQALFDNIVSPNCNTCSQFMSVYCDNGIVCVGKVLDGDFVNWKEMKLKRRAEKAEAELAEQDKVDKFAQETYADALKQIKELKAELTKEQLRYKMMEKKWMKENLELGAELAVLREQNFAMNKSRVEDYHKIEKLTAELAEIKTKTWCAYCGLEIAIDNDAADKISKHVMEDCTKHPIRAYKRHAEALEEQNTQLITELAEARKVCKFTADEVDLIRQWFNAYYDINTPYLDKAELELNDKVLKYCGRTKSTALPPLASESDP